MISTNEEKRMNISDDLFSFPFSSDETRLGEDRSCMEYSLQLPEGMGNRREKKYDDDDDDIERETKRF